MGEESEGFNDRIKETALKEQDLFAAKLEAEDEDGAVDENMTEEQELQMDLFLDREVLV